MAPLPTVTERFDMPSEGYHMIVWMDPLQMLCTGAE